MRARDGVALSLSVASLAFSSIVLPALYVALPYCEPTATVFDLAAIVGGVSAASLLAFGGLFLSLTSMQTAISAKSRAALALASISLAVATGFLIFGLTLRACPV